MADAALAVCLSCHAAVSLEEPAVIRNGARIALHVRCWRPSAARAERPNSQDSPSTVSELAATGAS
jgi:hypothetical protein